ncbi:site-specific DNA recombinase [Desulfohalotomaculum tongense]|uniref:recombinase family protein n=1 Tax=Desulforadius tongensis TaxID=1216062 RepID=UPI00195B977A|nr:recombinase family protein [Desulforadius tongensis]MBM7856180.1 site-specific DNA recombinase [Desulforadius tongensis]
MLAVVYIRVSTEEQARHGYSLSGQEDVCVRKAKELGATDIQIYKDEGISGAILERPGLQEALAVVKNSGAKYFVVYDPDRLSRKLSHQLLISETIEKAGCRLEFVNFDWEDTPEGRLFYSMRGAIAEYEKEKFLLRSKFGKTTKARKGLLTHNPRIFGYRYIPGGRMEINEEQASLYRQMVDMALKGTSPEEIAKRFNEMGIPGPGGGKWYRATVRRILKNPTYTGTLFLNRYNSEGVKTKRATGEKITPKERPKKDWIAIPVPPLISVAEWERIQEKLAANKKGRRGQKVHFYLLSKVLYCGKCGNSMFGTTVQRQKRTYRYYACTYSRGQEDRKNSNKCNTGYFRADELENLIWNKIKEWLSDPEALVRDVRSKKQKESNEREKKNLQKHINTLTKEKERIFTAYRRGLLDIDDLEKAIKEIKNKINRRKADWLR